MSPRLGWGHLVLRVRDPDTHVVKETHPPSGTESNTLGRPDDPRTSFTVEEVFSNESERSYRLRDREPVWEGPLTVNGGVVLGGWGTDPSYEVLRSRQERTEIN